MLHELGATRCTLGNPSKVAAARVYAAASVGVAGGQATDIAVRHAACAGWRDATEVCSLFFVANFIDDIVDAINEFF